MEILVPVGKTISQIGIALGGLGTAFLSGHEAGHLFYHNQTHDQVQRYQGLGLSEEAARLESTADRHMEDFGRTLTPLSTAALTLAVNTAVYVMFKDQ
jgi:hypothetical protein